MWLDSHEKDRSKRRHFDPVDHFKLQIEHMCDVLDGSTEHRILPENRIGQMKVIDAVYQSIGSGEVVSLE